MTKKMLELFAGRRCMSKAFERAGWETYSVEWSRDFPDITLYKDISELTAQEIIDMCGGKPDVIWLSPDCTTFSIAGISHHRTRNPDTGSLDAKSDYAKFCDKVDKHCLDLIDELKPRYWFMENPRGGMRKMSWVRDLPRYTVCYCLAGETEIVTSEGVREISDLVDTSPTLLTSEGWVKAPIKSYGVQKLMKLTLSRSGKIKEVFATPEHKWILSRGGIRTTSDLKKGQRLKYVAPPRMESYNLIPEYVARGFAFGDGHILSRKPRSKGYAMFCFDKKELMPYFDGFCGSPYHHNKPKFGDKVMMRYGYPREWKTDLPTSDWSADEKFSWIAGYIAADGSVSKSGQVTLSSSEIDNLITVRDRCREIGIDTYSITTNYRKGYNSEPSPLHMMTFMRSDIPDEMLVRTKHRDRFMPHRDIHHQARNWQVISVEDTDRVEEVYCAEVPGTHDFVLNDGLLTHNCKYGDTRMKPTDIWTNHPNPMFKPMCHNGNPDHEPAPRGSRTGTQGLVGKATRSEIPDELCDHIAHICSTDETLSIGHGKF